jgi:hypothetical protein
MKIFFSSDITTIDNSIFWSCLDDDADDALLLNHLGKLEPHKTTEEHMESSTSRAHGILFLRINILRCLQNNIVQSKNKHCRPMPHRGRKRCHLGSLSLSGISRIFGVTMSLSKLSNIMNKVRIKAFLHDMFSLKSIDIFSRRDFRVDSVTQGVPASDLSCHPTTNSS